MSPGLLLFLEIIGTVAFAASGATVGIAKKMDLFGVVTLGVVTSVGGGIIRDLVLGLTPPATFKNPIYALVAIVSSVIIFIPAVRKFLFKKQQVYDNLMRIIDSVGLGIFTVVGVEIAYSAGQSENRFLLIFVGLITGTGGGVIRDILAGNTPYILVKHFYASASIIGAFVYVLLWQLFGDEIAFYCGALTVIVLRLLAAKYRWSLPKAK